MSDRNLSFLRKNFLEPLRIRLADLDLTEMAAYKNHLIDLVQSHVINLIYQANEFSSHA
jgi:hypothetical protein